MAKKRAHVTDEHAKNTFGDALDRLTGEESGATAQVRKTPHAEENTIKLSVFLSQEEYAYLEKLASTAKFSGGKKLSKNKIIGAMVKAFRTSQLDVRGVKNEGDLLKRVIEQLRK